MYSNLITFPDILDNSLHTVTVVDAFDDEIELLVKMCQHSDDFYNIYLYNSNVDADLAWLEKVVDLSNAVILNLEHTSQQWLCNYPKTYYYSDQKFLIPNKKLDNILHYFFIKDTILNK